MYQQTIPLFRYLLFGILNRRLAVLVAVLLLVSLSIYSFTIELAIIDSERVATALLADMLRYCFVFLVLLLVATNIAEDFEYRQFERLLTMPINRWQYIAAQTLIIFFLALILSLSVFFVMAALTQVTVALYWSLALWLELVLVGLVGMVAILSIEKVPGAVFFSIAIYLLAKFSGLISLMLAYSVEYSDGSVASETTSLIFSTILYVIPSLAAFANNNILFDGLGMSEILVTQLQIVAMYSVFLIGISLIDFYRKEFNL